MVHLTTLLVFDTRLGSEDESASLLERAERILFFHPKDTDKEQQLFLVDSCLSMNSLASMFTDSKCDTVYLQDQTLSIAQCEPGLFFVAGFSYDESVIHTTTSSSRYSNRLSAMANALTPSLPTSSGTPTSASATAAASPSGDPDINLEEDQDGMPQLTGEVHAQLVVDVLKQMYAQARLFLGCITQRIHSTVATERLKVVRRLLRKAEQLTVYLREDGVAMGDDARGPTDDQVQLLLQVDSLQEELKQLLSNSRVETVRSVLDVVLPFALSGVDLATARFFHHLNALTFSPLEKTTFLSIQLFMQVMHTKFSDVMRGSMLLFSGHISWSSLPHSQLLPILQLLQTPREALALASGGRSYSSSISTSRQNSSTLAVYYGLKGNTPTHASFSGGSTSGIHDDELDAGFLDFSKMMCTNPIDAKAMFGEGSEAYNPEIFLPVAVPKSSVAGGACGAESACVEMERYRLVVYVQDHVQVVVLLTADAFESNNVEKWQTGDVCHGSVSVDTADIDRARMVKQERLRETLRQLRIRIESHLKPEVDQLSRAMLASYTKSAKEQSIQAKEGGVLDDIALRFVYVNAANKTVHVSEALTSLAKDPQPTSAPKGVNFPPLTAMLERCLGPSVSRALDRIRIELCERASEESMCMVMQAGTRSSRSGEDLHWVVGVKALHRQLYVLLDGKLALPEVAQHVGDLCARRFADILLTV